MVTVTGAVAVELLCRPVSSHEATLRRIAFSLSRSLADDGIGDDLYDALEEVLGERAHPDPDEAKLISDRFYRATDQLMQVVPHRVRTYPTHEMRLLLGLRDECPSPDQAVPHLHLRRFALAILAVLDLMGDDAL
jgi:hypothetical protein